MRSVSRNQRIQQSVRGVRMRRGILGCYERLLGENRRKTFHSTQVLRHPSSFFGSLGPKHNSIVQLHLYQILLHNAKTGSGKCARTREMLVDTTGVRRHRLSTLSGLLPGRSSKGSTMVAVPERYNYIVDPNTISCQVK